MVDEHGRLLTFSDAPERLLRVRQVADRLGVSVPTVYRLIARGELVGPGHVGRSSRWRERDIDAFIRARVGAA
jgi:excisionase family DNA binding protein